MLARVLIILAAVVVMSLALSSARAQTPVPDGHMRLDLVRGPLITSSRIMGLGGAFAGVGEGIDGIYRNPAAISNRNERGTSWFDIDFTLDWLFVSSAKIDWDGDTRPLSNSLEFQAFNLGLVMQFGPLGIGILATFYGWDGPLFSVQHADSMVTAGWAFADGEVIVGAGLTVATLGISAFGVLPDGNVGMVDSELSGQGADIGLLWRPRAADWRLGARFRTKSRMDEATSDTVAVDLVGVAPWQLAIGWSSYYSGEPGRRYNPALRSKVAKPNDRRYLLLSAELELLGTSDAYSLESMVAEAPRPSGRSVSLALHFGAEGEVIHDRLRARVGSYLEPVRVAGTQSVRPHMTGGIELHLFELLFDWKANFAFDLAPGWQNVTIGVGFWK